jgi:hypothetical protein
MNICFNDDKGVYALLRQDFMPYFVENVQPQLSQDIDRRDELLNIKEDSNPIIFFHEYLE